MPIEKNIRHIKNLIAVYEKKYGREPNSVRLLAVSKHQSIEKITQAIDAGQRAFGESYLQEALIKIAALKSTSSPGNSNSQDKQLEWHFIGPVQRNKTRKIAENFSWVHSVANTNIVQKLNDYRPIHLPPLNICIQVNISQEASKFGIPLSEIEPLMNDCLTLPLIKVRGLMAIPSATPSFDAQRTHFHPLSLKFYELRKKGYSIDSLSLGMSEDFEAAIAEGSTIIRIGSAIFGRRS
ncbi:MAG: YggS family pyridoxal phosphate enzyme [Gammaproteobacteria bacterium RIFCSPHIGHO2_12_FULL_37_14]|nr:MAG: YggS family pyridoxal phosphate enzyme [Gammaproteobacteria bacterium RIFCSPHIGHO2_12_FULL_37_14]